VIFNINYSFRNINGSGAMYGPPSDCKGKLRDEKVCVNVSVNKGEGVVKGRDLLAAATSCHMSRFMGSGSLLVKMGTNVHKRGRKHNCRRELQPSDHVKLLKSPEA
jgi:hypothetical protein